jgi:hypothetical protein
VLTMAETLPAESAAYIEDNADSIISVFLVGSTDDISAAVEAAIAALL